ncbi:MAG: hypothetical protein HY690_10510 [Chloroflexi bacterium]|nr:hypothetical protein [Chloroflexota bacterium]
MARAAAAAAGVRLHWNKEPMVTGRRVFVLGSGFSASFGLPTLRGLFAGLMASRERPGESDKEHVLQALDLLYPHFTRTSAPPHYPPFEEFLGLVSAAQDPPCYDEGYWETVRRSALRLLTDYLAAESREAARSTLLHDFVSRLEYGDVVITFNWDNLIEWSLQAQSRQVSFLGRTSSAVALLKLHGSLNWIGIPDGRDLAQPESVTRLSGQIVRTLDFGYYDVWDVLHEPPLIIPPVAAKRALADPFFRGLWHEALDAMVHGESVAFIGYSIPADDLEARGLLRIGWMTRTEKRRQQGERSDHFILIDPNPEICSRYATVVGSDVDFRQAHLSDEHLPVLFDPPEKVALGRLTQVILDQAVWRAKDEFPAHQPWADELERILAFLEAQGQFERFRSRLYARERDGALAEARAAFYFHRNGFRILGWEPEEVPGIPGDIEVV